MRVTVIGDVLLDEDLEGTAGRLCPDGPAPVVELGSRRSRAGGAGLVATMLRHDGHEVELVTALSDDEGAERLRSLLEGIEIIAGPSGAPTPAKTRLRAGGQSVCRIDEGCDRPPLPRVTSRMLEAVARADVIIVADYGRRLTEHPELRVAVHRRGTDAPVVWDPHPRGADPVPSSWLVTPNLPEAAAAAGTGATPEDATEAAARLQQRYGCDAIAVTLGAAGALLAELDRDPLLVPAEPVESADPCGAGDRFVATAATVLARGGDRRAAVRAAVDAAGAYLAAGGVSALGSVPLTRPADDDPDAETDARELARAVRGRGGTVVATGGCFDLLHAGHVRTLEAARALGDCLIVCLNSDASVRRLKGPQRPIIGEHDRVEMLQALSCVDAVLVFEEDGPEAVLEQLRPDLWVKGGDYSVDRLPEARLLESWGGRAITLPYHLGRSTTGLAEALSKVG